MKLTDVPLVKFKDGVIIVNLKFVIGDKIRQLINSYNIFRDKGIVLISEKYKMRINFIKEW